MAYQFPPELEQQLRAFVASGQYDDEGDVIHQAFEALKTREELVDFRQSIAESRDQAARGESQPLNVDAVMTRLHGK